MGHFYFLLIVVKTTNACVLSLPCCASFSSAPTSALIFLVFLIAVCRPLVDSVSSHHCQRSLRHCSLRKGAKHVLMKSWWRAWFTVTPFFWWRGYLWSLYTSLTGKPDLISYYSVATKILKKQLKDEGSVWSYSSRGIESLRSGSVQQLSEKAYGRSRKGSWLGEGGVGGRQEAETSYKTSKPTPQWHTSSSHILPCKGSITFLDSINSWRPSAGKCKPVGVISHSNLRSRQSLAPKQLNGFTSSCDSHVSSVR